MCKSHWMISVFFHFGLHLIMTFEVLALALVPEFIVHPESINTTAGTTVEFNCKVNNNPPFFVFRLNNDDVTIDDKAKGIMQLPAKNLNNGTRTRSLLVLASVALNMSQISCLAVINGNNASSSIAVLLVQGSLSSVVDLSYSFIDSSTVNISWSPPFTLPSTNITGYNISATSNGTTTNYFTSESYYGLLLTDITDSPCNEIIITVSGYNGLDGNNKSLSDIYLPSAMIGSPVPISVSINIEQQLSAVFDISDLCVGQYPQSVIFFLFTNGRLVNSTDNLVFSANNFEVVHRVSADTVFDLVASLKNLGGTFDINSTSTFSTFSIESVAITDTTDGRVCVECAFASFSTDSVCTVELVSNDSVLQYTGTFSRSSTDSTAVASGCISNVTHGVYTVRILNERGKTVDIFKITITRIVVATTATRTALSDMPSPSPSFVPTLTSKNNGDIIVGIVGGITAAVVLAACIVIILALIVVIIVRRRGRRGSADLEENHNNDSPSSTSQKNDLSSSSVNYGDSTCSTKPLIHLDPIVVDATTYETIPKKVNNQPDIIKESEYAQLHLSNQPIAALPLQSVNYIKVDHKRTTANTGNTASNTSTDTRSHNNTTSSTTSPDAGSHTASSTSPDTG